MILDGNPDFQKEMKNTGNGNFLGKYGRLFLSSKIHGFKGNIISEGL